MEILFFPNGNTAVLHDGEQQPRLQEPWAVVFAEWLESQGQDPAAYLLKLPNGKTARFFLTSEDLWSWRFEE
jgi:DNA gyrase inhibitor GyrI